MSHTAAKAEQADRAASRGLNRARHGRVMRLLGAAGDLADQPPLRLLCAAVIAAGAVGGDRCLAATGARMLAAHTLATLAKDAIKAVVDRTRPDHGDDPAIRLGRSDEHGRTSFPSGHSAGAVAVAQAFARHYPAHAMAARAAALAASPVQVPRGKHYLGDVVAGAVIGWLAEKTGEAIVGQLGNRGRLRAIVNHAP